MCNVLVVRVRKGAGVGPDELFQRAMIARRYYLQGRTRIQVADELGISRIKVARELGEAIASGMVEIKIHDPGSIDVELSSALQTRFGTPARICRHLHRLGRPGRRGDPGDCRTAAIDSA